MAISINWGTKVIYVPQAYLTPLGDNIYKLDLNQFRLDLKSLEDDAEGMASLDTHRHNTVVTLAGTTFARLIEIINGYTVTFEDGQYAVNAVGANSNIADKMNLNQVSLRTFNSAGLITITGLGITDQVTGGKWKVQGSQEIYYKDDNITEIMRFNLYDENGNLTTDVRKIREKRRVI